jgi:hypothetical protein
MPVPGYKTWATNDIPTAADFNELFADPVEADVTTAENITSTSYGDPTTPGPAVTKSLVNGQKVLVIVSARIDAPAAAQEGFCSFAVSGSTSQAATDANSGRLVGNTTSTTASTCTKQTTFTAGASGSHTFTMKYRVTGSTFSFRDRRITILPG